MASFEIFNDYLEDGLANSQMSRNKSKQSNKENDHFRSPGVKQKLKQCDYTFNQKRVACGDLPLQKKQKPKQKIPLSEISYKNNVDYQPSRGVNQNIYPTPPPPSHLPLPNFQTKKSHSSPQFHNSKLTHGLNAGAVATKNPTPPVAQFQAFKMHEDKENNFYNKHYRSKLAAVKYSDKEIDANAKLAAATAASVAATALDEGHDVVDDGCLSHHEIANGFALFSNKTVLNCKNSSTLKQITVVKPPPIGGRQTHLNAFASKKCDESRAVTATATATVPTAAAAAVTIKPKYISTVHSHSTIAATAATQKICKLNYSTVVNQDLKNRSDLIPPSFADVQREERKNKFLEIKKSEEEQYFEVFEYQSAIYNYLKEAETRNRPNEQYIKYQPDITESMRAVLIDWLVEVAEEYRLQSETLYLTVSYIDRFLSLVSVVKTKLQLLGTTAMFIAAKYEEIYPPEISEFVYITDDTYTKKQMIKMENMIVKELSFELSVPPTPLYFLSFFSTFSKLDVKTTHFAMYVCELSVLNSENYLQYLPSMLASSSILVARYHLSEAKLENVRCGVNNNSEIYLSYEECDDEVKNESVSNYRMTRRSTKRMTSLFEKSSLSFDQRKSTLLNETEPSWSEKETKLIDQQLWPQSLQKMTGYELNDLYACVNYIQSMYLKAPSMSLKAIRDKYQKPKFNSVALIEPKSEFIQFTDLQSLNFCLCK